MVLDLSTTLLLIGYSIPILLGLLLIVPFTSGSFVALSERFPSFATKRGRLLSGLNLTLLGGLAAFGIYNLVAHGSIFGKTSNPNTSEFDYGGISSSTASVLGGLTAFGIYNVVYYLSIRAD